MESRLEEQQDIFHITTPPKEDGNPRSRIQREYFDHHLIEQFLILVLEPNWGEYTP